MSLEIVKKTNVDQREVPLSVWQGVVLEESLEDELLLGSAKIVGTSASKLEKENRTMTFHRVEVPDSVKDEYIERAKTTIKPGISISTFFRIELLLLFTVLGTGSGFGIATAAMGSGEIFVFLAIG